MPQLKSYHRPDSVTAALSLLTRPRTVVLAGGTNLVAQLNDMLVDEVVDLQAIGLDQIVVGADTISLGAMVRLQTLVDHPELPLLIRQMAQREGPNTFRHVSTLGGTVAAADWESELFAALLVYGAVVTFHTADGVHNSTLADCGPALAQKGVLITGITIERAGHAAAERVARTPADKPIVAVCGRVTPGGQLFLAFCGVAERPCLLPPADLPHIQPPTDFRGSSTYRQQMAQVLSQRVLKAIRSE
ncbi:MAG: FAD binding domain-containing protein [Chloroflexi bacterium]|nr:FAD binding domain-containing protein [Chloroflexota bacterium]MBP8055965.1 FAD binding domain-containing protein [Chloroflexota bacterium]